MSPVSVANNYKKYGSLDSFFLPAFAKSLNIQFSPSRTYSAHLLHQLVLELCL